MKLGFILRDAFIEVLNGIDAIRSSYLCFIMSIVVLSYVYCSVELCLFAINPNKAKSLFDVSLINFSHYMIESLVI